MKHWQKIVIFTLILALPISLWASFAMAYHCQMSDFSSHSMPKQLGTDEIMDMHGEIPSSDSNNQSNFDCDENLNCSVSGCNATALLNGTMIEPNFPNQPVYQRIQTLAEPSDPDLLLRPPILLS